MAEEREGQMIRLYIKCEAENPADAVFCAWGRGKNCG